ncbi:585_t:CDS:10 [Diversispora eburnea]|uniref:1-phosphatidylinositol 4-kinase n=1 Tax=Diversispora eburnea TaxID=1213867 RepID=A0A9N8Z8A1_9GLOM|nr:585_t:CDS:10 [Diversispora eburnea]
MEASQKLFLQAYYLVGHLLISRTTESVALECFVLEICEKSTHMAILTLWYLQAYRSDLSANPFSPAFAVCKRVLNKCQAIVFNEVQNDDDKIICSREISSRQVRENTFPALVGIGAMLGGIAAPMLMRSAGQIAIVQGRSARVFGGSLGRQIERRRTHTGTVRTLKQSDIPNDDISNVNENNENQLQIESSSESESSTNLLENNDQKSKENIHCIMTENEETYNKKELPEIQIDFESSKINGQLMSKFIKGHKKNSLRSNSNRRNGNTAFTSPSLDDLHKGSGFSSKRYVINNQKQRPQSADYSPTTSERDDDDISLYRVSNETSENVLLDELEEYNPERQRRPLKGNYFHSELEFLLALQDISTRLIIVPREARQSTLRAELTLLNHNLPAEICIPLWCPATSESPYHHRVIRISPADAVVLNSADRVPYLLMVEVLEGEINLNISKLQAQKSLKRMLHDEKWKRQSIDISTSTDSPHRDSPHKDLLHKDSPHKDLSRKDSNKDSHKHEENIHESTPEHSEESTVSINIKDVEKMQKNDILLGSVLENTDNLSGNVFDNNSNLTLCTNENKLKSENGDETSISPTITALPKSFSRSSKRTASIDKLPTISSLPLTPVDEHFKVTTDSTSQNSTDKTDKTDKSPVPYTPTTPTLPESNSQYLKQVINRRQSNSADEFAERMRTAAVMLAQLNVAQQTRTSPTGETIQRTKADTEAIRKKIINEMMGLEEERMMKMKTQGVLSGVGANGGEGGGGEMLEDETRVLSAVNKDDPSAAVFSEEWETKKERIRKSSPFGNHSNWRLISVIVKTGADLRQEQLACQLIREMQRIWQKADIDVYRVLVTSDNSGLIETIQNSISIHSIKKDAYAKRLNEKGFMFTLFDYFVKTYGDVSSEAFLRAQDNFMRSLAAYSLVCYILQVKDRHNGNVLLDTEGHLIHIDFGFMLSNSPGSVGFELAPFKLSQEYLDILGGLTSEKFAEFKTLLKQAFVALRKHADNFVLLVEMMSKDSKLPCFLSGDMTHSLLKDRFLLSLTEPQFEEFVEKLIMQSCCNVFTRLYDTFQYYSNEYLESG